MGFLKNYWMTWVIALGSSVGLYMLSAVITILIGENGGFLLSSTALLFNITASGFILLTMIPLGVVVILFGLIYNIAAPTLLPFAGGILDPWLGALVRIFGGVYTPIATSYVFYDIQGSITSTIAFLDAAKGLLIQEILSVV